MQAQRFLADENNGLSDEARKVMVNLLDDYECERKAFLNRVSEVQELRRSCCIRVIALQELCKLATASGTKISKSILDHLEDWAKKELRDRDREERKEIWVP
jgi:hypothetical protein